MPEIIAQSVKPIENIDGIKILHVEGLNGSSGGAGTSSNGGGIADQAVDAALRFRSQAPLVDALMAELGISGGTLDGLAKAAGVTVSEGNGVDVGTPVATTPVAPAEVEASKAK